MLTLVTIQSQGLEPVRWSLDPIAIGLSLLVAGAYARRAHRLSQRNRGIAIWRQLCFYLGIAILLAALISPLDSLGETRLFYAHMVQHLAIGELAPLAILLGLSGPMLRPLLALPSVVRLRWLLNPLVALPLWAVNLYLWHLPALYEAALHNELRPRRRAPLLLLRPGC